MWFFLSFYLFISVWFSHTHTKTTNFFLCTDRLTNTKNNHLRFFDSFSIQRTELNRCFCFERYIRIRIHISCANTAWCFCFQHTIPNEIINQITIWMCVIVTICIRTYPRTHTWLLRLFHSKTHFFPAVIVYFGNEIGNSISIHNL